MLNHWLRLLFFLGIWTNNLSAQLDTVAIQTIVVSDDHIRDQSTGSTSTTISKNALLTNGTTSLAGLLEHSTGVHIKHYGLGSLATASVRGGSASQTQIQWNGIPLQNPTLGQLDLSLLPTQAISSISFTAGGGTSLWGNGAIGGVINLKTSPAPKYQFLAGQTAMVGSFGQLQQHSEIAVNVLKFGNHTQFIYRQANNDFNYELAPGLPERRQSNAKLFQKHLLNTLRWSPNLKNELFLNYWHQYTQRQIPPTNVQNRSEASQEDLSHRLQLHWKHLRKKDILHTKLAYFNEQLNYRDPLGGVDSPSSFETFIGETNYQWSLSNHLTALLGGAYFFTTATTTNYNTAPQEHRFALFSSLKYTSQKLQLQLSSRQTMVDNQLVPNTPSLGWQYAIWPKTTLKGKISRNYRLPSFNDRFWRPGGNPDLRPESGWSQEMTLSQEFNWKNTDWSVTSVFFNRNIDDWILWAIKEGDLYFSANNIAKVWSRGFSFTTKGTTHFSPFKISYNASYHFTRSTNQIAIKQPNIGAGEQLWYTPIHKTLLGIGFEFKTLQAWYQHYWVGETEGINEDLQAFQTGSLRFQYQLFMDRFGGKLFFNVENIWDASYFIIERRPMPGRHFQIGLNLNIFKKHVICDTN